MFLRFNKDKWGSTLIINTDNITSIAIKDHGRGEYENEPEIQINYAADYYTTIRGADNIRIFDEWLRSSSAITEGFAA